MQDATEADLECCRQHESDAMQPRWIYRFCVKPGVPRGVCLPCHWSWLPRPRPHRSPPTAHRRALVARLAPTLALLPLSSSPAHATLTSTTAAYYRHHASLHHAPRTTHHASRITHHAYSAFPRDTVHGPSPSPQHLTNTLDPTTTSTSPSTLLPFHHHHHLPLLPPSPSPSMRR